MPRLLLVVLFMLVPVNAFGAKIDGFKDIKFGMTVEEVKNLGITNCIEDHVRANTLQITNCIWKQPDDPYTLFGRQIDGINVIFDFDTHRVDQIRVYPFVGNDQSINEFKKAIGQPEVLGGQRLSRSYAPKQYFWADDNANGGIMIVAQEDARFPAVLYLDKKLYKATFDSAHKRHVDAENTLKSESRKERKQQQGAADKEKPPELKDY